MKRNIIEKSKLIEALDEADDNSKIDKTELDKAITDKDIDKTELDGKGKKLLKAVWKVVKKHLNSFATKKSGDLIDELLLGQFKDSLIDVYKKEKLDKMKDDEASKELEELQKNAAFKKGVEYNKLDSRKDDNTSTEIDEASRMYSAMWFAAKDEENVGKQINDLVIEIQKSVADTEKEKKELTQKLKSLKVDASEDDINNFGPILVKAIADGQKGEEISKNLKKLKGEVKESCNLKLNQIKNKALLTESKFLLTEDMKQKILIESIVETDQYREVIAQYLLNEGFFSKVLKVAGGVAAGAVVYKVLPKKWQEKVKDFGTKTVKFLSDKTFNGLLALGGFGLGILTGGWAAEIALKGIYLVEKHGKVLSNAFERQFTRFANSKGIIAEMDFSIKDQKDSKYGMRFYVKDMVWRVINLKDQLKHPGKDYAKQIVDGEQGKKFRERLAKIWDPLFSKEKGGKIDFKTLFDYAKNVKISEKSLKAFQDFAEQYEKIKSASIDSPKIDTRTQSLKKDKLDK